LPWHRYDGVKHEPHLDFGNIVIELVAHKALGKYRHTADASRDHILLFIKAEIVAMRVINTGIQSDMLIFLIVLFLCIIPIPRHQ
jgi:hypothetical protein